MSDAGHPTRFVHFLPTFPQRGGTGVLVQGLVDAGRRQGRDDEVVSYRRGHVDGSLPAVPLPTRLLMSSPVPLPFVPDVVADRLLGPGAPGALVLHGVFTPSCSRLSMEVGRRRPDVAVVADPHDAYDEGLFGTRTAVKRAYWAGIERPYLRRVDVIVVAAPSHADRLGRLGVATTTLVVPPGLSPADAARAVEVAAARGRRPAAPRLQLLALGRWDVHEKGIDLLCEAADDPSLRPHVRVRLVGPEVGARSEIEALLRRHRLDNFEAVGYVDDVWPELLAADALVLPSRKEGFGLVALQALASGLPVLLSTAAGMAEYVEDGRGVVLVRPTAPAVRAGLHELVDRQPQLAAAAQAASSRFALEFTCDRVMDRLADVLARS